MTRRTTQLVADVEYIPDHLARTTQLLGVIEYIPDHLARTSQLLVMVEVCPTPEQPGGFNGQTGENGGAGSQPTSAAGTSGQTGKPEIARGQVPTIGGNLPGAGASTTSSSGAGGGSSSSKNAPTYRFSKMQIEDESGELRDIPVMTFAGVGLTYNEIDITHLRDTVKQFLTGKASFGITIAGPWGNEPVQDPSGGGERPALSGSHTVLSPLVGNKVPRAFGVFIGAGADWDVGMPVFGGDNVVIIADYTVNPTANTYTCKLVNGMSGLPPAWGTGYIAITYAFAANAFDNIGFDAG